jgi:hypothetical protein
MSLSNRSCTKKGAHHFLHQLTCFHWSKVTLGNKFSTIFSWQVNITVILNLLNLAVICIAVYVQQLKINKVIVFSYVLAVLVVLIFITNKCFPDERVNCKLNYIIFKFIAGQQLRWCCQWKGDLKDIEDHASTRVSFISWCHCSNDCRMDLQQRQLKHLKYDCPKWLELNEISLEIILDCVQSILLDVLYTNKESTDTMSKNTVTHA